MKKLTLFGAVCLFLATFLFVACSDDSDPDHLKFEPGKNGEWILPDAKPVAKADFEKYVVGSGWKHIETHEIKSDGKCEEKEYYEEIVGVGPTQYYFEKDSCTSFFYFDAAPANCYSKGKYAYVEEGNRLENGSSTPFLTILSVDDNTLTVIDFLGIRASDLVNIYGVAVYKKMTAAELEKCRKDHPTNFKDAM